MKRVHNYFPGPAALPLEALQCCQDELLDYQDSGMSIMEMSHRTDRYEAIHNESFALVRELFDLPDNYKIVWLQGGGSMQFAMVPMNLLLPDQSADYIMTGFWSERAITEARIIANAHVAASSRDDGYCYIPTELDLDPNAGYVHLTSNNTIMGTQFFEYPETNGVPIVADMSSDVLSRPIDFKNLGIIFAGAHKNLGPAGAALVIIRDDILERCSKTLPTLLSYRTHVEHNSMFNTPVTFTIYMVNNVLRWMKEQGGLKFFHQRNQEKGRIFYECVDNAGGFFTCPIRKQDRSIMNAVFETQSKEMEERFLTQANENGFIGLKNLPQRGGLRVSMYNATSLESIQDLVAFMNEFIRKNG